MDALARPSARSRRPWLWAAFAAAAVAALLGALPLFPRAFPILELHISMNQAQAQARAQALATGLGIGPASATTATEFTSDDTVQNYVELQSGGVSALRALIASGAICPYTWTVRRFNPGQVHEASFSFTPAGAAWGFAETIGEAEPGPALTVGAARSVAVAAASSAPWDIDLGRFHELAPAHTERPNHRVDHTFTFERTGLTVGEAPVRLYLVVTGGRLSAISRTVEVPERFKRSYAALRATNELIANVDQMVVVVLVLLIGAIAVVMMTRRRILAWRAPLCCGLGIGLLVFASQLNQTPLYWFQYDTAHAAATFQATLVIEMLSTSLAMGLVMSLTFLLAEGLSRMAFPGHPRLWEVYRAANAGSNALIGRVVAGYLLVAAMLALQIVFYAVVNEHLHWWSPASALTDPNALACWAPWLTPCAQATQAGMWEESLFRAIPLAAAGLLGRRLGYPRTTLAIAVVLQAVMFGAAHTNYPNQPAYARLVEIAIPFAAIGVVYIRYGLVVGMVMHFCFDLTLMSLPLFASDAPGIGYQRLLVILVGSLPLTWVLVARLRTGAHGQVSRNGDPEPARAARVARDAPVAVLLGPRALIVICLGSALALLAAALPAALASRQRPVCPALRESASQGLSHARAVLQAQGVDPAGWSAILTTGPGEPGAVDRTAWRMLPGRYPGYLADGWLWGPCSTTRFVHWHGSLESRAQEWSVTIDARGRLVRIGHTISEAAPGASLDEAAAVALGAATLGSRFPQEAASLHLRSSTPQARPARRDWILDYGMQDADPALLGVDRHVSVAIAGERVVDAYRYLYIPEDLSRAQQRHQSDLAILEDVAGLVTGLLLVGLLVTAVVGCFVARQRGTPWLAIAVACTLLELAHRALSLPETLVGFSSARPLSSQLATAVVGEVVWSLMLGAGMAVLVLGCGLVGGIRAPALPRLAGALWGLALCALAAGAGALMSQAEAPPWRDFADSDAVLPALAVITHGLLGGIITLVLVQSGVIAVLRVSDHWRSSARAACGYGLCLALGVAAAGRLGGGSASMVALVLLGATLLLMLSARVVLRDPRTVLACAAAIAISVPLSGCLHPGFPLARPCLLVVAALVGVVALWWSRRAAIAVADFTPAAPPG